MERTRIGNASASQCDEADNGLEDSEGALLVPQPHSSQADIVPSHTHSTAGSRQWAVGSSQQAAGSGLPKSAGTSF